MSENQSYTLDEARQELQRRECSNFGHSWDFITAYGSDIPSLMTCICGKRCRIKEVK